MLLYFLYTSNTNREYVPQSRCSNRKPLVHTFVLTLGTKSSLELDYQNCLRCLAGVSSGNFSIMRYWTGSQCNDLRSDTESDKRGDWVTTLAKQFCIRWNFKVLLRAIL